jgi:parallel beta-helix repeat protein
VTRTLLTPVLLIVLCAAFAPAPAIAADVRQFGAVGDGVTDDTAAIQKAVDSKTGDIEFAKGRYVVSKPVVIDLDQVGYTSISGSGTTQVVMTGPGPAFRFIGTHGGTASPATVKDNVWANQRTPMVDGIEILGAHEEAVGIEADGTMQLTVSRVVIRKALHGIHLVTRNRNVLIANCHIYENRGVGIYLDGVNLHQINVLGSHISYNLAGGIVFRHGNVRNLHVGTCDIEGNHPPKDAPSETATANILLDCHDSTAGIGEIAITGCTIQHSHDSPDSANIRMLGSSAENTREGHVAITGNVLSDVQVNIDLHGVRGATITGNTIWKGFDYDLILERCNDVVVSGNSFDRNPRYRTEGKDRGGILLRDCQDCILNGIQIAEVRQHTAGILIDACRRVNVTGCSVVECDNSGIVLSDCTMCRVSDCLVQDDRPSTEDPVALRLTGGKNNMVVNNLVGGRIEVVADAAVVRDNVTAE